MYQKSQIIIKPLYNSIYRKILWVRSGGDDIQRLYADLYQLRDLALWKNFIVHDRKVLIFPGVCSTESYRSSYACF